LRDLQESEMTEALIMKTADMAEPSQVVGERQHLLGMTRDEMTQAFAALGIKPFRVKQVWNWIYRNGVSDFAAMSNIGKETQSLLEQHFFMHRARVDKDLISFDGTRKWLFEFSDGQKVETVLIPEDDRGTLCISSQVGCTLACTFCHTGTQRLVRNLTASEIVDQVLSATDALGAWKLPPRNSQREPSAGRKAKQERAAVEQRITNIVFMGMGEPLFNYEHVKRACEMLIDDQGLYLSRRKVTISTSGVVPKIKQMADELGVNLAISLHATNDALRNEIVPINRKYPLKELIESLHYYADKHPTRSILIEYVMLKDVNDSDADAQALVALLKGLDVKVNLIPFNPWPGSPYLCSSNNRIHAFARILAAHKIPNPIRTPRGQDILAACGQLKSDSELKKGQKVKL
jgi:23S rRNA (adenine2503-C2)-methyltransferase